MTSHQVSVCVRVRPVLQNAISAAHQQEKFELIAVHKQGDGGVNVEEQRPGTVCRSQAFSFDYVFDSDTSQLDLYEDAIVDSIDDALQGYPVCVFAYGQTGSGKTHSILGDVKPNPLEDDLLTANSGVFLRVLSDLLEYRARKAKDTHVVIGLSCLEVYNEKVRDLFGGTKEEDPPELRTIMIGENVLTPGLITKEVTSMMSVFAEIQLAIERRSQRATDANATSSRSHCLFQIDILQQSNKAAQPPNLDVIPRHFERLVKSSGGAAAAAAAVRAAAAGTEDFAGTIIKVPGSREPVKFSRLLICDLAGSERIDKSGVTGAARDEAININKSLTALGNVVHALHEGDSHISFRDSNLTRLLAPSFSQAHARVLLIAHCSPTQLTYDESVSTLHFANKVKAVRVVSSNQEVDNTVPEFLESVKTHDQFTSELRVFRCESQTQPVLTANDMSLLSNRFRCVNLQTGVPREAERMQQLERIGAIRAAQRQIDEVAARERREQEELAAKVPQLVNNYVSSHRERCLGAREQIAKCRAGEMPFVVEASEDFYIALCEEADAEFAEIEVGMTREVQQLVEARNRDVSEELARARSIAVPKVQMEEEFVQRVAVEDAHYSLSCAAHCNGRRFLNSFLEMRDTHAALLVCLSNIAAGQGWIAKQPKPAADEEEDDSGMAGGGAAAGQPEQQRHADVAAAV